LPADALKIVAVRTVPVGVIAELIRGDVFYWGQLTAGALRLDPDRVRNCRRSAQG